MAKVVGAAVATAALARPAAATEAGWQKWQGAGITFHATEDYDHDQWCGKEDWKHSCWALSKSPEFMKGTVKPFCERGTMEIAFGHPSNARCGECTEIRVERADGGYNQVVVMTIDVPGDGHETPHTGSPELSTSAYERMLDNNKEGKVKYDRLPFEFRAVDCVTREAISANPTNDHSGADEITSSVIEEKDESTTPPNGLEAEGESTGSEESHTAEVDSSGSEDSNAVEEETKASTTSTTTTALGNCPSLSWCPTTPDCSRPVMWVCVHGEGVEQRLSEGTVCIFDGTAAVQNQTSDDCPHGPEPSADDATSQKGSEASSTVSPTTTTPTSLGNCPSLSWCPENPDCSKPFMWVCVHGEGVEQPLAEGTVCVFNGREAVQNETSDECPGAVELGNKCSSMRSYCEEECGSAFYKCVHGNPQRFELGNGVACQQNENEIMPVHASRCVKKGEGEGRRLRR